MSFRVAIWRYGGSSGLLFCFVFEVDGSFIFVFKKDEVVTMVMKSFCNILFAFFHDTSSSQECVGYSPRLRFSHEDS